MHAAVLNQAMHEAALTSPSPMRGACGVSCEATLSYPDASSRQTPRDPAG